MSPQTWLQRMLTEMTLCCTQTFSRLWIFCGGPTLLTFSSFRSKQLPRFNSPWANPCCEDADAFSFRWDNENNWLFPPPNLFNIRRMLQHLAFSKAEGTLIVPEWTSAHLWPLLYQKEGCFISEVREFWLFTQIRTLCFKQYLGFPFLMMTYKTLIFWH